MDRLELVEGGLLLYTGASEKITIDLQWLRDHCRCASCFDETNHQRKSTVLDFSEDARPEEMDLIEGSVTIAWNDGHVSEYRIDWLVENAKFDGYDRPETRVPWRTAPPLARIDHGAYVDTDDEGLRDIAKSLLRYGVALVRRALPATIETTERVVTRLAPVQKTLFGEMWELNHDLRAVDHKDTAYSHDALGVHTDNTYWSDAAGLQIFHCYEPAKSGGETLLVDGLRAADDLKSCDEACHERLSRRPVAATYIEDGQKHTHVDPILKLNPLTKNLLQIRFNLYDRSVVSNWEPGDLASLYRDLRKFATLLNQPERTWRLKLEIGDVLFVDNWRVLHGRTSYTGTRHLGGCYVARTDWTSKAAVLGLLG